VSGSSSARSICVGSINWPAVVSNTHTHTPPVSISRKAMNRRFFSHGSRVLVGSFRIAAPFSLGSFFFFWHLRASCYRLVNWQLGTGTIRTYTHTPELHATQPSTYTYTYTYTDDVPVRVVEPSRLLALTYPKLAPRTRGGARDHRATGQIEWGHRIELDPRAS
jgi:hypothetical protein